MSELPDWAAPTPDQAGRQPAAPPAYSPPPASTPGPGGYWGPAKPGIVALRPLGFTDILDGAIGYIRRDLRTVLTLSALIALVQSVLAFIASIASFRALGSLISSPPPVQEGSEFSTTFDIWSSTTGNVGYLTGTLLSVLVGIVANGLLTVVIGQAVLGEHIDAGQTWRIARPRLLPLIGLSLLISLFVFGTFAGGIALAVALGFLLGSVSPILGVLVGLLIGLAAIAAAIWLNFRFWLASPALVLERVGIRKALRRSDALVRGSWWRIFGIAILALLLSGIIGQVLAGPFAIAGGIVTLIDNGNWWWAGLLLTTVGAFLSAVITIPFTAGVTGLQYIDQRIRREALDLQLLAGR